jgi:hypothetical protein
LTEPLNNDEYEKVTNCGIIARINNQYVAIHYTFIEHFVAETLIENLDDVRVAGVVINEILVSDGYEVVRMFINNQIDKYMSNSKSLKICQEIIAISKNNKAIFLAAEEGNAGIFEFLFNSLIAAKKVYSKTVQQILLSTFESCTCFFPYFWRCDAKTKILDQIKNLYGLDFVRQMLTHVNPYGENVANIVIASTYHGKNYANLFEWILVNFKNDINFMRESFMSVDQNGDGILHNAFDQYDESSFKKLLEILGKSKSKLGEEFLAKLIQLSNKSGEMFFFILGQNSGKCDLIPVFDWIKKIVSNKKTLHDIICAVDNEGESLLHKFAKYCDQSTLPKVLEKTLNWIRTEFGTETTGNLILQQNTDGKTFIDLLLFDENRKENFSTLNEILRILLGGFGINREFVKGFLSQQDDEDEETLLHYYTYEYKKKSELCVALKEFLSLVLEYLGKETLIKLLFIKNQYGHTFLNNIVFKDEENEAITVLPKILDSLRETFRNDQLMKEFLFQKDKYHATLLHFYARMCKNSNVTDFIKIFLKWIKDNLGADAMEEIIFSKSKGQTFLSFLLYNKGENRSVKEIMDWLKIEFSFDKEALIKLTFFENDCILSRQRKSMEGR